MVFVPSPTATNIVPFHATPRPAFVKIVDFEVSFPVTTPVHVLPSVECAIVCSIPSPTATQIDPFHAAPYPVERTI